ncbi:MAG TPA: D-glycero-beta-D-manno-heptose 1-phosphate adenylyltransferase [Chitinophagales bacterium]|nr:D-glycero-beta-D-manno-heptose 1-phosphate adenylyltransferase [Chitinophagales bacterium]
MESRLRRLQNKVVTLEQLQKLLYVWRFKGDRIVFTNGCFDILHAGHIHSLALAAGFGHRLVIGLNSDASVRDIKKPGRPLQDQHSRALVLAALDVVDAVVLFEEKTPVDLIQQVKPDVLAKGGDYKVEDIAGADFVLANGGSVEIIALVDGYSTTAVEEKIRSRD